MSGNDYGEIGADDDYDNRTVVDDSLWSQPKIPYYPALTTFGRFEILGRIARGGMAEVFLARDKQPDGSIRHVVVKRVLPEMEDNPDFLAMFFEEGKTAVRLYHTNVCHVYEVGEVGGRAFMALEWVYGTSMQSLIERVTEKDVLIGWPVVCEIVACVASALQYVHHAKGLNGQPLNIVHRDVSPHNVMLTWGGGVKLLDFGIAKTSGSKDGGGTAGKYAYMSPEQAHSKDIDARSDIFALGIVLYEGLTAQRLYDRPNLLDTFNAIVHEPVPSVRAIRQDVPEALDAVVRRALAKDAKDRFQSAGEMFTAIKKVLKDSGQMVTEQRIGLTLNNLFAMYEKQPLTNEQRQLQTGAFAPLTNRDAAQALQQQSGETFTFDHDEPSQPVSAQQIAAAIVPAPLAPQALPPTPPSEAAAPAPQPAPKKKSRALRWIGITLLVLIAIAAGGFGGLWYMRGELPWPLW
jgi:serine/threonine protein kinase